LAAAIFISSLIAVARTSSAPRKMKGKPRTLLTWFGIVRAAGGDDRIGPHRLGIGRGDLGIGLAIAKMIGWSAIA
jgi:hypothetical protein